MHPRQIMGTFLFRTLYVVTAISLKRFNLPSTHLFTLRTSVSKDPRNFYKSFFIMIGEIAHRYTVCSPGGRMNKF